MLHTANLTLRPLRRTDLAALAAILGDPITMRFWPAPLSREETKGWIERNLARYAADGFGRYAVELRATGALIGDCGIVRTTLAELPVNDLGYIIHHPYWRRGYASEAAQALKSYAFADLQLAALHANMAWDHHGSRRVAEKLGMRRIKEFHNQRNRGIRTFIYALEREQ